MDDLNEEFFDESDIEAGKTMALLCFIPVCCVNFYGIVMAFVKKDNDFHCFHARQSLGLTAIAVAFNIGLIMTGVIAGLISGTLAMIVYALGGLISLVFLVLFVIGILNTLKTEFVPLPIVGPYFTKYLGFLKKEDKI